MRADADDLPAAVARSRRYEEWRRVESIEDAWRVAEEWWRETPHARTYVRLVLDDGRSLTLFRDDLSGRWFEQAYAPGSPAGRSLAGRSRASQRRRT